MKTRGFEVIKESLRKTELDEIKLPHRGTVNAAAYDFFSPINISIPPHESKLIWTDIKAYMGNDEVLLIDVRSSMGKYKIMLANTIGVIDSDYYENKSNDGNIGINLYNMSDDYYTIHIGDKIAQGIFTKYLIADNGNTDVVREGGFGSTGK